MSRSRRTDNAVGTLKQDGETPVYQCKDTGLLYYWAAPPKRYVSVWQVGVGDLPEDKDKSCRDLKR